MGSVPIKIRKFGDCPREFSKDAAVKHGVSCRRGTMEDFLKELAK